MTVEKTARKIRFYVAELTVDLNTFDSQSVVRLSCLPATTNTNDFKITLSSANIMTFKRAEVATNIKPEVVADRLMRSVVKLMAKMTHSAALAEPVVEGAAGVDHTGACDRVCGKQAAGDKGDQGG